MQYAEASNMDYRSMFFNTVMQQGKAKTHYKAALYLRLSRDDSNGSSESMSIQSQRQMLISYAMEHEYEVADIYADDGFSGTNFDRPDFKRMINDIKLGRVNMVITKDLSRLGRNYVITGQYTDFFFPENNVRYIAINDNVDTQKDDNDIAPFKNILNEMYAKDISKKVRSSRKVAATQGKFMGSNPPYGYKRSANDKHKLVIDDEAAEVVRRIFELYKNRESARCIADILNKEKILTPQNHYYASMGQENPYKKNANTWSSSTITSIIPKEVYIGDMVQNKKPVKSFKSKKRHDLPPEMWVVVKGTHEAIVDPETFYAANYILQANKNSKPRKTSTRNESSLFSSLIRCKDCNSRMTFTSRKRKTTTSYEYRCSRHLQHGKEACSPHGISLELLSAVVLEDIRNNAELAIRDEDAFIQQLHKISIKEKNVELDKLRIAQTKAKNRLSEIDKHIHNAFEKNSNGILPDNVLKNLLEGYDTEKISIESELTELNTEMLKAESQTRDISKELEKLKQHAQITELTRKIVTSIIQCVYVSEPEIVDGQKQYDIEIRYKFQNPSSAKKEDTQSAN